MVDVEAYNVGVYYIRFGISCTAMGEDYSVTLGSVVVELVC